MKRLLILTAISSLLIFTVACSNGNSNEKNTDISIPADIITSQAESSSEPSLETSSEPSLETSSEPSLETSSEPSLETSELDASAEAVTPNKTVINENIININEYKSLNVDNITFEEITNGNNTITRPLYPTLFSDNTIYVLSEYYTQKDKSITQNSILSYDINTTETHSVSSFDFNIGYDPDFVFNNHYFTLPCTHTNDGELQFNIIVSDIDKESTKNLYNETVTSPYYYADYINENEVIFLIFPNIDGRSYQRIIKYNLENDEISVLYENEYIYPKIYGNICTFDTYNGFIFLLNTQVINGERKWNVVKMDSSGNILDNVDLTGLYDYRSPDCIVNQFVVTKNKYLIQYFDSGTNSAFVIIDRENENNCIQFDKLVPSTLASPFWIQDRYLVYRTFPDYVDFDACNYSSDISIYDSIADTFYFFKIEIQSGYKVDKVISNEKGDIVLVVSDDTNIFQYLLITDIISYIHS